jgi:hypothetical protein
MRCGENLEIVGRELMAKDSGRDATARDCVSLPHSN